MWIQTMMEMAKVSELPKDFYRLFQNGFARKEERSGEVFEKFVEHCQKTFGKEGITEFNKIMKEFYENVGVVPKTQYNELREKYVELRKRVLEMEEEIEKLRKKLQSEAGTPSHLMDSWMEVAKKYTEMNQQFFSEFQKYFE
jgi:hypothetical protein